MYKVYVDYTIEDHPRPFYVGKGKSCRLRLKERNQLHSRISEKYGCERRVVFETDVEQEAFDKERELIAEYDTYVYGPGWGANFTLGGEGTSGHPKPHVSGKTHPMYGRKHTEESKRKNSESNKISCAGEKNGMYGKRHSEETRKKIGDSQRGWEHTEQAKKKIGEAARKLHTGKKRSAESRKRMSEARKGKSPWNKGLTKVTMTDGSVTYTFSHDK